MPHLVLLTEVHLDLGCIGHKIVVVELCPDKATFDERLLGARQFFDMFSRRINEILGFA
jgi:hypothetical protein